MSVLCFKFTRNFEQVNATINSVIPDHKYNAQHCKAQQPLQTERNT